MSHNPVNDFLARQQSSLAEITANHPSPKSDESVVQEFITDHSDPLRIQQDLIEST